MRTALVLGLAGLLSLASPLSAETPSESIKAAARIEAISASESRITLYSLVPEKVDAFGSKRADTFHDFPILGQAKIASATERAALLEALASAALASDGGGTKCFNPRHALRVETPSGTLDFVICFQCRLVSAYGADPLNIFQIGGPSDAFDLALKAHGLRKAD